MLQGGARARKPRQEQLQPLQPCVAREGLSEEVTLFLMFRRPAIQISGGRVFEEKKVASAKALSGYKLGQFLDQKEGQHVKNNVKEVLFFTT